MTRFDRPRNRTKNREDRLRSCLIGIRPRSLSAIKLVLDLSAKLILDHVGLGPVVALSAVGSSRAVTFGRLPLIIRTSTGRAIDGSSLEYPP